MEIVIKSIRWRSTNIRTYFVSECGEVANIEVSENGKVLKFYKMKFDRGANGYLRVPLKHAPGKEKKYLVHRLVYEAFVGNLESDKVIDHIDANKENNHFTNLRQVTQKENIHNAIRHGNFGGNNKRKIRVYDKLTKETNHYNSIKEFIISLGIPLGNGSLHQLKKYSKYKDRFEIVKEGQSTTESVTQEKDLSD